MNRKENNNNIMQRKKLLKQYVTIMIVTNLNETIYHHTLQNDIMTAIQMLHGIATDHVGWKNYWESTSLSTQQILFMYAKIARIKMLLVTMHSAMVVIRLFSMQEMEKKESENRTI